MLVCSPFYEEGEGIDAAWELGFTGKGVTIAIIDVGVDVDHLELRANIVRDCTQLVVLSSFLIVI